MTPEVSTVARPHRRHTAHVELIVVYRAVGKLAYGHTSPTHTTDCTDPDEAQRFGAQLVDDGVWSEFYVKTIWRPRHQAAVR